MKPRVISQCIYLWFTLIKNENLDLFDPLPISGVRVIEIFSYLRHLHHLDHWLDFSFYFLARWFPSECVGNVIENIWLNKTFYSLSFSMPMFSTWISFFLVLLTLFRATKCHDPSFSRFKNIMKCNTPFLSPRMK